MRHCRLWMMLSCMLLPMALPLEAASATQKQGMSFIVEGSIKDLLGRPIPGASVSLESQEGRRSEQTTSNDHGAFRLDADKAGSYTLKARRHGFKPATRVIQLLSNRPSHKPLELVLESESALSLPL